MVSENSPNSEGESIGRPRVSAGVAIAIVLLCGALGVLLGLLFPLDAVQRRGHEPAKAIATTMAPAHEIDHTLTTPSPASEKDVAHSDEAQVTSAPQEAALDSAKPSSGSEATSADSTDGNQPQETSKNTRKLAKADRPQRRATPERAVRTNRARYANPKASPRSIVSQLPIVGPVIGLVVP